MEELDYQTLKNLDEGWKNQIKEQCQKIINILK